jgi:hypothetical protein
LNDRLGLCRRTASVLTGPRLVHAKLGVLAATPVNGHHHFADFLVDVDDNLFDECAH